MAAVTRQEERQRKLDIVLDKHFRKLTKGVTALRNLILDALPVDAIESAVFSRFRLDEECDGPIFRTQTHTYGDQPREEALFARVVLILQMITDFKYYVRAGAIMYGKRRGTHGRNWHTDKAPGVRWLQSLDPTPSPPSLPQREIAFDMSYGSETRIPISDSESYLATGAARGVDGGRVAGGPIWHDATGRELEVCLFADFTVGEEQDEAEEMGKIADMLERAVERKSEWAWAAKLEVRVAMGMYESLRGGLYQRWAVWVGGAAGEHAIARELAKAEERARAEEHRAAKKRRLEEDRAAKKRRLEEELARAEELVAARKRRLEEERARAQEHRAAKKRRLEEERARAQEHRAAKKRRLEEERARAEEHRAAKKRRLEEELARAEELMAERAEKRAIARAERVLREWIRREWVRRDDEARARVKAMEAEAKEAVWANPVGQEILWAWRALHGREEERVNAARAWAYLARARVKAMVEKALADVQATGSVPGLLCWEIIL